MAPKKKRPETLAAFRSKGTLNDFHTGFIYGLHLAQQYPPLSQVDIASIMGVASTTILRHIGMGAAILEEAENVLEETIKPDSPRGPEQPAAEEAEVNEDIAELLLKCIHQY